MGVRRLAVANGPNIFQMLLVPVIVQQFNAVLLYSWCVKEPTCVFVVVDVNMIITVRV